MPYDPRSVSNVLLKVTWRFEQELTNLKLQKLLFLSHAIHLMETERPLVNSVFEAWKFGPVNRESYNAFRGFRDKPITSLAQQLNPVTGHRSDIPPLDDHRAVSVIRKVVAFYGNWSAAKLVG
jgi:uncharacterized phage-associated protein